MKSLKQPVKKYWGNSIVLCMKGTVMMRKKIITVLIVVGVLLTACLITIGKYEREKQEREKEILLNIQSVSAKELLREIDANGEVIIQNGKVVISNFEIIESRLIAKIAYYNWMTKSRITLEQIKEQVDIYVKSYEFDESTEELKDFCAYVKQEELYGIGVTEDYYRYNYKLVSVLEDKGLDRWTANREQLEEACKEALEELGY